MIFENAISQPSMSSRHLPKQIINICTQKCIKENIGIAGYCQCQVSDIKKFYGELLKRGFKPNGVEIIQTVFNVVLKDGYIRINPTDGAIAEIKKSHDWEKPKRHALTAPEQEAFVDFVARFPTCRHWPNLFAVLLGTGIRIGECLGLRWEDCDFKGK